MMSKPAITWCYYGACLKYAAAEHGMLAMYVQLKRQLKCMR